MNKLRENLIHVRNLMIAMKQLNAEEEQYQWQIRGPVPPVQPKLSRTGISNKKIFLIIAGVFVLVMVRFCSGVRNRYKADCNEAWLHYYNTGIAYEWEQDHPGESYFDSIDWKPKFSDTLLHLVLEGLPIAFIVAAVASGILAISQSIVKAENKKIIQAAEGQNQLICEQNKEIEQKNQELRMKIARIHERKSFISQEYNKNVILWYPKDYGFLPAVDYFISLVDNHLVDSMKEAVEKYNDYIFKQQVLQNQQEMVDNQKIMIGNMEIMLSKQDELIRQQMLGNMLHAANLAVNMENCDNTRALRSEIIYRARKRH